jgi:hypothetical protein
MALLSSYIAWRLGIKQMPSLILKRNVENAKKDFGYTGDYERINKRIRIFITDRHPNDVLRTFAHELIHHWQNERGVLQPSNEGSENPSYAQNDDHLRKCEYEAYLFGNILFRDWQDANRHGSPATQPPLPPRML